MYHCGTKETKNPDYDPAVVPVDEHKKLSETTQKFIDNCIRS